MNCEVRHESWGKDRIIIILLLFGECIGGDCSTEIRFFPLVLFSFSGCVAWVLLETTCAILSSPQ